MSKKDVFISEVEQFVGKLSEEAKEYFEDMKKAPFTPKGVTDKGKVILKDMQDNLATSNNNEFTAKEIGDRLGLSGRSVSGSIRSLITLEYVEKVNNDPVKYGLTTAGKDFKLD